MGTGLLDGMFCLTGLAGFLLLMLRGTDGRLRLYLPLGMTIGFGLYRKTLSVWILRLLLQMLRLVGQAVAVIQKALLWMFGFPRGN